MWPFGWPSPASTCATHRVVLSVSKTSASSFGRPSSYPVDGSNVNTIEENLQSSPSVLRKVATLELQHGAAFLWLLESQSGPKRTVTMNTNVAACCRSDTCVGAVMANLGTPSHFCETEFASLFLVSTLCNSCLMSSSPLCLKRGVLRGRWALRI